MPLLSIVVPFYGVEDYIGECIDSLRRQTLTDIEVVLVDDGSTDGSAAIAHRHAEQDRRLRVIAQPNQGLGPARNTGLEASSGEFVAFVDSDDVLSADAFELLVSSLQASGSELASSNARRFDSLRVWPSYLHSRITATIGRRIGTHIYHHPTLALDRMAWNKVFRRSLLDRLGVKFPSIRYEDYPVTLACHLGARSVDWVAAPTYYWRVRNTGTSITQAARELDNLRDRVNSARLVGDVLRDQPDLVGNEVRRHLGEIDLPVLLEVASHLPAARHELDVLSQAMLRVITPEVLSTLPSLTRSRFSALQRGDWERFDALSLGGASTVPSRRQVRLPGTQFVLTKTPAWDGLWPALRDGGVRISRVRPASPVVIDKASRSEDGGVQLEGNVAWNSSPPTAGTMSFHVVHVDRGLDETLVSRALPTDDGHPAEARFQLTVPHALLVKALPSLRGQTAALRLEARDASPSRHPRCFTIKGTPWAASQSSVGEILQVRAAPAWCNLAHDQEIWVQPRLGRDSVFEIGLLAPALRVRSLRLHDAAIGVQLEPEPSMRDAEVFLLLARDGGQPERHPMSLREDGTWDVAVPAEALSSQHPHDPVTQESRWRVQVQAAGRRYPLMPRTVELGRTHSGHLTFSLQPDGPFMNALVLSRTQPVLRSVTADDEAIILDGSCNGVRELALVLIAGDAPSEPAPLGVHSDGTVWQAVVDPGRLPPAGTWVLGRATSADGPVPLRIARGEGRPPIRFRHHRGRWMVNDDGGRLTIETTSPPVDQSIESSVQ